MHGQLHLQSGLLHSQLKNLFILVGHLIVRFADKEKLENARKEFEENMDEINISVVEKEKKKSQKLKYAM